MLNGISYFFFLLDTATDADNASAIIATEGAAEPVLGEDVPEFVAAAVVAALEVVVVDLVVLSDLAVLSG
jgi:hypothetical protein